MQRIRLMLLCGLQFFLTTNSNAQPSADFSQQVVVQDHPGIASLQYDLLNILAKGSGKTIRSTLFTVTTTQTIRSRFNAGTYTLIVQSKPLTITGDIYYRQVNISTELAPSSVQFKLTVTASGFSKNFTLSSDVKELKPKEATTTIRDTVGLNYSFSISDYILQYTNEDLQQVRSFAKLIDEYYQDATVLDQNFRLLQNIDPYNYADYRSFIPRLDAAQSIYNMINSKNYPTSLSLNIDDPARLTEKLNAYNGLLQSKRNDIQQVMSTLHLVFFTRGSDAMRAGDNHEARDLFFASLEINPAFAPSLLQLARLDFIKRDFNEARCKSDEILFQMQPDPETRIGTIDLLKNIQEAYLDEAATSIYFKQFDKALKEYLTAKEMCEKYNGIRCTDELFNGLDKAYIGIYQNLIVDAKNFYSRGDFSATETQINKAINYHALHLKSKGEPKEALDLLKALRQKRYDQLINTAKQFADRSDYATAIIRYLAADSLQKLYSLNINVAAEKTAKETALSYATQLLKEGDQAIQVNKVAEARFNLNKAIELLQKFYLGGDATLKKNVNLLSERIYGQECMNAQTSIDSVTIAGNKIATQKDYLGAMKVLQRGEEVITRFSSCRLFKDSLEAALNRVRPAGTYLELYATSMEAEVAGNYNQCVDYYKRAATYFSQYHVGEYGISNNPDIYNYAITKGSNGLIRHLAQTERDNNHLENSLSLYKLLLIRDYSVKLMEEDFYRLGLKTGAADKISAPGGRGKTLASRYTSGDKRLKRFEKGYVKGYK